MYGIPSASCSTNYYTSGSNFSNLQAVLEVASSSNIPVNNNIFNAINNCITGSGSSNLPVINSILETANISSISSNSPSNIPFNNNIFKPINCANGSSSYSLPAKNNVLEEKSSNIPATEVLEEMYKVLKLDIPPVFTFRQETITQKFFCSAGFMNKWYDTKEAFPNQEGAKEAAAQSLLKIIMASEEYEKYLQAREEIPSTNHQANVANVGGLSQFLQDLQLNTAPPEKIKKRRKKYRGGKLITTGKYLKNKKRKGQQSFVTPIISKKQKRRLQRQLKIQNAERNVAKTRSKQGSNFKKVKFDDKIFILGEDVIPKSNISSKSIMSHRNQSSGTSSQYNQLHNELETYQTLVRDYSETYQTLVREYSEKDKIRIPPSKLLDEFCIFFNISKPKYDCCDDGYGNFVAEILVGDVRYMGEQVFWYPDEAQECAAEKVFNILYAKADKNARTKFKERISLALADSLSRVPTAPQQRYESQNFMPSFPNYIQPFEMPTPQMPASYCNVPMGFVQPMFNIPTTSSTSSTGPVIAPPVPNLGSFQQTHREISAQVPTELSSSTANLTVPQQQNESVIQQFPKVLHKLVSEKDLGIVEYQYSKTLKGYKCTCYVKKLKFTSNPYLDKEYARNQAAKIAFLALLEYNNCEI